MERANLYEEIARRTQGDIYIGVVGPVRTGKSTFIKRFVELLLLPGVENEYARARLTDELPQSAAGRTIMTTQPRFVPNEALGMEVGEGVACRVRLVDCVGYLVPGAAGHLEADVPRMVQTPWSDREMPFAEAAEIGTRKVMTEHSTIGVVMTTDGSITELPRESYVSAEERVVEEMKATGKPFLLVLNSVDPQGDEAVQLRQALSEKYGVGCCCINALQMTKADARALVEGVLMEFPLKLVEVHIPGYIRALPADHPLLERVMLPILTALPRLSRMRDYTALTEALSDVERFRPVRVEEISLGEGVVRLTLQPEEALFYEVLSERCGCDIRDEYELMTKLAEFARAKEAYDGVSGAIEEARRTGYGVVPPVIDDMELTEPEIVRQGSRVGVRLRARASGLHVIRVDVESEVSPVIGTEEQSEALVQYLTETFETDPQALWQTNIFGKPLYDLVREGMEGKAGGMPWEVRERIQETLQRIVNEGCNSILCIML